MPVEKESREGVREEKERVGRSASRGSSARRKRERVEKERVEKECK